MVRVVVGAVSVGAAWFLLLVAAVLRLRPGAGPVPDPLGRRLTPVETALLRGGDWGAAQTALVELYLAGSVEAGWRRTVRPGAAGLPRGCSAVARAMYHALFGSLHPRRLYGLDRVRDAVRKAAPELEQARLVVSRRRVGVVRGLLLPVFAAAPLGAAAGGQTAGWLLLGLLADAGAVALWVRPRRTLRGAAHLARLRRSHAEARRATERRPDALLLSVALFGAPALRAQLPRSQPPGSSSISSRSPTCPRRAQPRSLLHHSGDHFSGPSRASGGDPHGSPQAPSTLIELSDSSPPNPGC
ncbi:TIGR04222 domain-containing membrane protein [Streptomyces sp. C]|uniref:TIGR04222 domain-containing membrane protein n=1 Tax=Streptomyces sp. C TaxID=253839 RepID=UPI0013EC87E0|nr:TIGR04222 domain-containing membrane protein [Streptomyces sp. C]